MSKKINTFHPLNICVLTVSDTRTKDNDTSGQVLENGLKKAGHTLFDKSIVKDNIYEIRAVCSDWIFQNDANVILITGGTGFSGRDSTPEAMSPLFDKNIDGFGELFRAISFNDIGSSTIQSRACAGLANNTLIFCMPGSTNACATAWEKIIEPQINALTQPCHFVGHITKRTTY